MSNVEVGTELSSQVVYSLSFVILFENSLEKVARLLLFLIHVSKRKVPFRPSVLTISRSSKTHSGAAQAIVSWSGHSLMQ